MITTGVLGHEWRASITPAGAIEPWGGGRPFGWYVAADDRWHVPADEVTVRQTRVDGTAVAETRVRVPRGDVVQSVYSVADGAGLTVIEIVNQSPLPVAIAFDRRELLTERPIGDLPVAGIDLPAGSFVLPLGHQAALRVGIGHRGGGPGPLPAGLPPSVQVARGWLAVTDRASRMLLPDGDLGAGLVARVVAERCEIALGVIPTAGDDPAGYAIALGELVRMGERADPWLPELVDAVERLAGEVSWRADAALAAAGRVLAAADEARALRDLLRIGRGRTRSGLPDSAPSGPAVIAWAEARLADGASLVPVGFPAEWLGQSFEVYGVPTSPRSAVSYAVRWHGARPAVLWEQTGEPVELSAPAVAPQWRAAAVTGESLWPEPPGAREALPHPASGGPPPDGAVFG